MVDPLVSDVLGITPRTVERGTKGWSVVLAALGVVGLGLGFLGGNPAAGWVALLVSTAVVVGLGAFGAVLSAIFEITGAKWGRAYRRIAEASAVLMPLGLVGLLILLAGASHFLPWVHAEHLAGGKAHWLVRGFWDARVLLALLVTDALGLLFLYYSFRRDFCVEGVRERFSGPLSAWLSPRLEQRQSEAARCEARMSVLAPVLAIVFSVLFSLLAFDLIMALEPDWYSTLFGAWYFISVLFSGLAGLAIVSLRLRTELGLGVYLTRMRQSDLATLLFAFTLLTTDFFWCQYLTIWYGHLPDEVGYIIVRNTDASSPWSPVSWVALAAFFAVPFIALLFRRVKASGSLLAVVAAVVVASVFLARFLEIAPPLMVPPGELGHRVPIADAARSLLASVLTLCGFCGVGWYLFRRLLTEVPIMPIGDPIFVRECGTIPPRGTE